MKKKQGTSALTPCPDPGLCQPPPGPPRARLSCSIFNIAAAPKDSQAAVGGLAYSARETVPKLEPRNRRAFCNCDCPARNPALTCYNDALGGGWYLAHHVLPIPDGKVAALYLRNFCAAAVGKLSGLVKECSAAANPASLVCAATAQTAPSGPGDTVVLVATDATAGACAAAANAITSAMCRYDTKACGKLKLSCRPYRQETKTFFRFANQQTCTDSAGIINSMLQGITTTTYTTTKA